MAARLTMSKKVAHGLAQPVSSSWSPTEDSKGEGVRLRLALEAAGVRFIDADEVDGPGVRLAAGHEGEAVGELRWR